MVAVAYGGAAVLAALDRQRRTGLGAFIDLAQYETGLQFVAPALLDYAANGVAPRRNGNRDPVAVPHGCYPCLDGRWVALSCWDDDEWTRLTEEMSGTSLASDTRLSGASGRRAHEAELNDAIARWTRERDAGDVAAALHRSGVHAAIVNTMRDLYEDPHLAARQAWQPHDHRELGPLRYRMVSYQLSETPGGVRSPAPCLGEHNVEVFRDWFGLSAEEYEALSADGVFS
jgi:crotonobetainyl-CoA:carnitine CoA-transferase CaiB-like acyl-CoA transferase